MSVTIWGFEDCFTEISIEPKFHFSDLKDPVVNNLLSFRGLAVLECQIPCACSNFDCKHQSKQVATKTVQVFVESLGLPVGRVAKAFLETQVANLMVLLEKMQIYLNSGM